MQSLPQSAVLLVIDVQEGFDSPYWGNRNNPQAEANISRLLDVWRRSSRPVVHVRHDSIEPNSPLRPDQPGNKFKAEVTPLKGEYVDSKCVNSAFIGTGVEKHLKEQGFETLVLVGLTTDHCVSTSARMAANLGFKVVVVADCTATHDRTGFDGTKYPAETVHALALASLHNEFATVMTVDQAIAACQTETAIAK